MVTVLSVCTRDPFPKYGGSFTPVSSYNAICFWQKFHCVYSQHMLNSEIVQKREDIYLTYRKVGLHPWNFLMNSWAKGTRYSSQLWCTQRTSRSINSYYISLDRPLQWLSSVQSSSDQRCDSDVHGSIESTRSADRRVENSRNSIFVRWKIQQHGGCRSVMYFEDATFGVIMT